MTLSVEQTLQADYLVIGAGAVGLAFADTIVTESAATVVIVDRAESPGGHWTTAYPFVRLHQPAAYYGVNSRDLGTGVIEDSGDNVGLYELAGVDEIRSYYDTVMLDLTGSRRVRHFASSEYHGDRTFTTASGERIAVDVGRRVVDTTHSKVIVPSMRPPTFLVGPGVDCVPPNALPRSAPGHDHFVVIGGGKTGMDSCLWLLRNGISPERIAWIVPRESWLLDRANVQPGTEFADRIKVAFGARLEAIAAADSVDDLFARLEMSGSLLRLHADVEPTMYRCATVTQAEAAQLRRITDVVRMGHVHEITAAGAVLGSGELNADTSTLWIDCAAEGLGGGPSTTIFSGSALTPQCVRACQQVFSAAFIAHVELTYDDDVTKNALCEPIHLPGEPLDWLTMSVIEYRNQINWFAEPQLMEWLHSSRLNAIGAMMAPVMERRPRIRQRVFDAIAAELHAANDKLDDLLAADAATHAAAGSSP
ncbi:NAD(P)-binding protein [Mycolicibacterium sp. P1-5]|uniref:NAD(P)-binding protein n=1 Tax=Mycolicibacterium sp. P1-5 TaxID=2024617 RepID=UPI0011ECC28D|nr:NAD(P)-binding protein [Mycolicibacterium sp. P1-5]KAA0109786.1 NAD(P)/FAD-dependent oxidoreductase [Mycolicibacterium sp. P1-5]